MGLTLDVQKLCSLGPPDRCVNSGPPAQIDPPPQTPHTNSKGVNLLRIKVRLHRHICLWWASEQKLGKKPVAKPNKRYKNQGNRARHSATK